MSSQENQVVVKLTEGQSVATILHGQALPNREPSILHISGDINAPKEFFEKRAYDFSHESPVGEFGFSYDSAKTNVVINKENGSVTLTLNEESYFKGTIVGTLKLNKIIQTLKINNENFNGFTPAELAKILRMNRHLFADKEFFNNLVKSLQDFKAKFDTEFQNSNDKRGNIANSVVKKLVSEHNYNFSIQLPVFEGLEPVIVPIEVDIDYSGDAQIRCSLISVELNEIIEVTKDSIIEQYKQLFEFCPVIIQ